MAKNLITFLLLFVSVGCGQIATKTTSDEFNKTARTASVQKSVKDCVTFKFHYLEIENVLYSPVVRHIEIFLDEKAFSEENLKTLFAYLSEKNPEPKHLTVVVHTNWAQLGYPSDCPGIGLSNQPARPDEYDYLQATYYRRAKVEYFDYSQALKIDASEFKRVILRNETRKSQ